MDANGNTVGTATAGSDGSYTVTYTAANFTAPFVITASDPAGQISTMVSVLASPPAAGGSSVANVTTLTTAQVALLTSDGNPLDMVKGSSSFSAANLGNINAANLLASSLANILPAGASSCFDPIGGKFAADGTGLDAA
ncbi:hypothetical protein C2I19_16865 [Chromobacterium alticapitis]|uniref:Bacterial Ig domain-containing protein n=1 Tax=Chromobacterium alticapitis TaxID=2073169 RepID=A0A2S5DCN5_9NEIS|nr:hypothetical protein C2I19_16865 [Chromobacterium alticapitis]